VLRQFTYRLFSLIAGINTNMMIIIFLAIIAKIALVCDGCDIGNWGVNNFDWNKVGITIVIQILTHRLLNSY
jgi:hypothetical protein